MIGRQLKHAPLITGCKGNVAITDAEQFPVTDAVASAQESRLTFQLDHDTGEGGPGDDTHRAHAVEHDGRRGSRRRGRWRRWWWRASASREQRPLHQRDGAGVDAWARRQPVGAQIVELRCLCGGGLPGTATVGRTGTQPQPAECRQQQQAYEGEECGKLLQGRTLRTKRLKVPAMTWGTSGAAEPRRVSCMRSP